jgi:hypothetical protein
MKTSHDALLKLSEELKSEVEAQRLAKETCSQLLAESRAKQRALAGRQVCASIANCLGHQAKARLGKAWLHWLRSSYVQVINILYTNCQ